MVSASFTISLRVSSSSGSMYMAIKRCTRIADLILVELRLLIDEYSEMIFVACVDHPHHFCVGGVKPEDVLDAVGPQKNA